jgi:hypothetical protein
MWRWSSTWLTGAARGGQSPLGQGLERSEAKRRPCPRGLIGNPLRPPPPLRTPTYRSTLGVQGAARPPVCKPAPGVVGGPVRG